MTDLLTFATPAGAYVLSVSPWLVAYSFALALCAAMVVASVAAGRVRS